MEDLASQLETRLVLREEGASPEDGEESKPEEEAAAIGAPSASGQTPETETTEEARPKYQNYSTYIYRVLQQVHPGHGISRKAMAIMNRSFGAPFSFPP